MGHFKSKRTHFYDVQFESGPICMHFYIVQFESAVTSRLKVCIFASYNLNLWSFICIFTTYNLNVGPFVCIFTSYNLNLRSFAGGSPRMHQGAPRRSLETPGSPGSPRTPRRPPEAQEEAPGRPGRPREAPRRSPGGSGDHSPTNLYAFLHRTI